MNQAWIFRQARHADIDRILQIIRSAQRRMKEAGSSQWQDGYPARADIASDIDRGAGYVICMRDAAEQEEIVAYGAVGFDGEPAYDALEGRWLTEGRYVMAHRMAVAEERLERGIGGEFIRCTEEMARLRGIGAFRIDTSFDNRPMLALLRRAGFTHCGRVFYRSGEREAFEKML